VELAAFDACAAVVACFIVVRGYVFRGDYMVWNAESDQGAQRVTAARAATANDFRFLLALKRESQVNETCFVAALQNNEGKG
jgi:hypothetical protein